MRLSGDEHQGIADRAQRAPEQQVEHAPRERTTRKTECGDGGAHQHCTTLADALAIASERWLSDCHDEHEQRDRQAYHDLRREPWNRDQQLLDIGGQERPREFLGEDEDEQGCPDLGQLAVVFLGGSVVDAESEA